MPVSARSARYSGSERPAWRMNHTGTSGGAPTAGRDEERRVAQVAARGRNGRHDGGRLGDHDSAILPRRRRVPRARQ